MQERIRSDFKDVMPFEIHSSFVRAKSEGSILHPDLPAETIARLVINPCLEKSGMFLNWDYKF